MNPGTTKALSVENAQFKKGFKNQLLNETETSEITIGSFCHYQCIVDMSIRGRRAENKF